MPEMTPSLASTEKLTQAIEATIGRFDAASVEVYDSAGNIIDGWGIWAEASSRDGTMHFGYYDDEGQEIQRSRYLPPELDDGGYPAAATGTVTWRGGFVGNAELFQPVGMFVPVFGATTMTMDLADTDHADIAFTGLKLVGRNGATHALPDPPVYTLTREYLSPSVPGDWLLFDQGHDETCCAAATIEAFFYRFDGDPVGGAGGSLFFYLSDRTIINGGWGAVKE